MSEFKQFPFIEPLQNFIKEEGFKKPTEVQTKAIDPFLKGEHLSVLAQTGSGKTLAYCLPLFQLIKQNDENIPMEEQFGSPRAVVLTPTRELNHQVSKVLKSVSHHGKLRIRTLVGGDKGKLSRRTSEEAYDILVASPGRLLSALKRKEVKANLFECLVYDEADQLLDMGFTKEIQQIMSIVEKEKKGDRVQVCLFSATWPAQYKNFLETVFPEFPFKDVVCQGGVQFKRNIETFNINLGVKEKKRMLEAFLSDQGKGTGVIFINKKEEVEGVATYLKAAFPRRKIHSLHGGATSANRKKAFDEFRKNGGVLVASDIAARGLDIKGLGWVLNYDLPFEAVYYIHRCGRTGRDGKLGRVFNFITVMDQKLMGRINEAIVSQSSLALKPIDAPRMMKKQTKSTAAAKASKVTKVKKKPAAPKRKKTPRYKKKKR
jgi:superfamily II DNA/RNA helicase